MSEGATAPTIDDFRVWVDQPCEVAHADVTLPMTLVSAREIADSPRAGGGFELEFLGPAEPVMAQNIVQVRGPDAVHSIFLVPVARDAAGTRYAATYF